MQNSSFIGFAALEAFTYEQKSDMPCPFCVNHCNRTVVQFSSGGSFVTGNRCERGQVLGDPQDEAVRSQVRQIRRTQDTVANLYQVREQLLFQEYDHPILCPARGVTIGLPRVLVNWGVPAFLENFLAGFGLCGAAFGAKQPCHV